MLKKILILGIILLNVIMIKPSLATTTWTSGKLSSCPTGGGKSCNVTIGETITSANNYTFDNLLIQSGVTIILQNRTWFNISAITGTDNSTGWMNITGTINANGITSTGGAGGNGGSGGGSGRTTNPSYSGGYNGSSA
jgi:hypothetical protein